MKIITLNTWGGRAGREGLLTFLERHRSETDFFCLQEVWSAPYENLEGQTAGGLAIRHTDIMVHGLQEISALMQDFTPLFRPHNGDHYGLLMLVKKTHKIMKDEEVFVHKYKGYVPPGDIGLHARNIHGVTVELAGAPLTVINFHGLWNGKGKGDSDERREQSLRIRDYCALCEGRVVLCGDFNLLPHTESIHILEDSGLRNLVVEGGVISTRTSYYTKEEKFADYIFVSRDVEVVDFSVLPDEVSDHAPLSLEIRERVW